MTHAEITDNVSNKTQEKPSSTVVQAIDLDEFVLKSHMKSSANGKTTVVKEIIRAGDYLEYTEKVNKFI
jgi:hypothetical protein